jgi:hypothetical protein
MIPNGAIVEWFAPLSSITTGLVENVTQRRIARVSHTRDDGLIVAYDPDGIRCVIDSTKVNVIAENADAGWGNLK